MSQRLYRIELGRPRRRIESREQAHHDRKTDGSGHQPPGHIPEIFRPELLTLHVDVGANVDDSPDDPAESYAKASAEQAHGSSFIKEDALDVAVAGAYRFHDPDLASSLQDRHDQRVDDAQRGYGQRQTAKNPQEEIEHGKKTGNIF